MKIPFLSLLGSAARTVSGNGDAQDLIKISGLEDNKARQLIVQSNVTAASGTTPSLTVLIQDSVDGGVTWNTVGTFVAQTAVNRAVIRIGIRGDAYPAGFAWPINARWIRVSYTISGTTPSFTFSVSGVLL